MSIFALFRQATPKGRQALRCILKAKFFIKEVRTLDTRFDEKQLLLTQMLKHSKLCVCRKVNLSSNLSKLIHHLARMTRI
jgi:hypothetical protein